MTCAHSPARDATVNNAIIAVDLAAAIWRTIDDGPAEACAKLLDFSRGIIPERAGLIDLEDLPLASLGYDSRQQFIQLANASTVFINILKLNLRGAYLSEISHLAGNMLEPTRELLRIVVRSFLSSARALKD